MSDLLTAKDVEVKEFKKVRFGGYAIPEVEDFLNQVADDLEAYALQIDERDARIVELESYAKKQDEMTDAIKDALIQARQAAKEMEDKAQSEHDSIVNEAKDEAERILTEARSNVQVQVEAAERKANEILAQARTSASEAVQASKDKRDKAEQTLAEIEHEIAERRQKADSEAEGILANARAEARKIVAEAREQEEDYQKSIQFLSLKKQQFLKDTVSMLLDFGKIIEDAQEETDEALKAATMPDPSYEIPEPQLPPSPVNESEPEVPEKGE